MGTNARVRFRSTATVTVAAFRLWPRTSSDGRASKPSLCRLDAVPTTGVERDGGLWRMEADQVHDLLEERKQLLGLADPAADDHDIPPVLGQARDEVDSADSPNTTSVMAASIPCSPNRASSASRAERRASPSTPGMACGS